jgi:SAM-dependent methyltransferase
MAYETDLAYIHDTGFGDFASGAAPGLIALLRRSGVRSGRVIDLGCGSGILAAELIQAGYSVLGVDISQEMIKIARRKAPGAMFVVGSLHRVDLPHCDAIAAIGEALNYCFDSGSLSRLFQRVHRALRPGGVFVFDVAQPGVGGDSVRRTWTESEGWAVLVESEEDRRRELLIRRIVTFRKRGAGFRRAEETHKLKLFRAEDLVRELGSKGFRAKILQSYGRMQVLPGRAAVFAIREP